MRLTVRGDGGGPAPAGLEIVVEDDGPGLDPSASASLTRRGERGDEAVPGQGIGLAVVSEILSARDGQLEFDESPLGGARVTARLPGGVRGG